MHARTALPAGLESTTTARRFAERTLRRWRITDERFETARLLVSELVANAVTHAQSPTELSLDLSPERLRVEVRDQARERPEVQHPTHEQLTGRGLMIVEALADRWGVDDEPPGKVVWFELGPGHAGEADLRRVTTSV